MGTKIQLVCSNCGNKKVTSPMFDVLLNEAKGETSNCGKCELPMKLHLEFSFAFGASGGNVDVLKAFVPEKINIWHDPGGNRVEYYPFLVILRSIPEDKISFWLPYWHLHNYDGKTKKKYGQWAPLMDKELFESLLLQAKNSGYA